MKGFIKHFLLAALLIFHTSAGTLMAAQMQSSQFDNVSTSTAVIEVATIDSTMKNPCPHHSKSMEATSSMPADQTMNNCSGHDCSNCDCVNVLSSIPTLTMSIDLTHVMRSNIVAYIPSTIPDSPLNFILRPPIS